MAKRHSSSCGGDLETAALPPLPLSLSVQPLLIAAACQQRRCP